MRPLRLGQGRDSCSGRRYGECECGGMAKIKRAVTLVMPQPATPAREPPTWSHVPSRPLMQSALSRYRTPTTPRSKRWFFRVRPLSESPRLADHPAYFGLATLKLPTLSAIDARKISIECGGVNAQNWCILKYLHRAQCSTVSRTFLDVLHNFV